MTVSKLTNNIKPLDEVDKINEIIDELDNIDPLPSQTGQSGKYLTTNGTVPSWAEVTSGATRNIGEIVSSTIPLTDAGLHLLDGALIQGSGIYSAFVTYIAGLVSTYPNLFVTESAWQTAVTTYGVCGKFVYDSVNNTVRLPKVTGFTEGTVDPTTLGDLTQAGLPNITGKINITDRAIGGAANNGFVYTQRTSSNWASWQAVGGGGALDYTFDASRSSSIYGNNTTVQPQSVKVLYYIVVATVTKTDIEVDIDEVVTDLNGKADRDLSNCTKPHIVETYVNGSSWYRVYSDGWCEQGGRVQCGSGTSQSLSLLNTFADTNYNIETTIDITNSTSSYNCDAFIGNKTSSAVTIYCKNGSGGALGTSYYFYWQAKGYIR